MSPLLSWSVNLVGCSTSDLFSFFAKWELLNFQCCAFLLRLTQFSSGNEGIFLGTYVICPGSFSWTFPSQWWREGESWDLVLTWVCMSWSSCSALSCSWSRACFFLCSILTENVGVCIPNDLWNEILHVIGSVWFQWVKGLKAVLVQHTHDKDGTSTPYARLHELRLHSVSVRATCAHQTHFCAWWTCLTLCGGINWEAGGQGSVISQRCMVAETWAAHLQLLVAVTWFRLDPAERNTCECCSPAALARAVWVSARGITCGSLGSCSMSDGSACIWECEQTSECLLSLKSHLDIQILKLCVFEFQFMHASI